MKKVTVSLLLLGASLFAMSPSQAQTKGRDKFLNAGIGLATYTAGGVPIGTSLEVGINNNISVGGFLDYARHNYKSGGYKLNYNFFYFGARGSYHLAGLVRDNSTGLGKFDPYAGLSVGVRTAWYSDNQNEETVNNDPYAGGLFVGMHIGSRYMFTPKVGGFAEVGYGVSALRLGAAVKF